MTGSLIPEMNAMSGKKSRWVALLATWFAVLVNSHLKRDGITTDIHPSR